MRSPGTQTMRFTYLTPGTPGLSKTTISPFAGLRCLYHQVFATMNSRFCIVGDIDSVGTRNGSYPNISARRSRTVNPTPLTTRIQSRYTHHRLYCFAGRWRFLTAMTTGCMTEIAIFKIVSATTSHHIGADTRITRVHEKMAMKPYSPANMPTARPISPT